MAEQFRCLLTEAGAKLAAKALAESKTVKLTAIAIGDGGGEVPEPDGTETALKNEVYYKAIDSSRLDKTDKNIAWVQIVVPADVGGFWIREFGVYAEPLDGGEPVLFSYGNHAPYYKIKAEGGQATTHEILIPVHIFSTESGGSTVEIIVPEQGYVTHLELEEVKSRLSGAEDKNTEQDNDISQLKTKVFKTDPALLNALGACYFIPHGNDTGRWQRINGYNDLQAVDNAFIENGIWGQIREEVIDGQHMIRIPKFYYKTERVTSGAFAGSLGWWVSSQPVDGFIVHPAFMPNGEEKECFYIGKYAASVFDGKLQSVPNVLPSVKQTFKTFRQQALKRNIGCINGFHITTIYELNAVQLLFLTEFCSPDAKKNIGMGAAGVYHDEGVLDTVDSADNLTSTYRGIVGLWGNVWQFLDCIKVQDKYFATAPVDGNFFNSDYSGTFDKVPTPLCSISGMPDMFFYETSSFTEDMVNGALFLPTGVTRKLEWKIDNNITTINPDGCWWLRLTNAEDDDVAFGGDSADAYHCGLFSYGSSKTTDELASSNDVIGARLMKYDI